MHIIVRVSRVGTRTAGIAYARQASLPYQQNQPCKGPANKNGDLWENRTPVYGVRGRRLSRLTNRPCLPHIVRHMGLAGVCVPRVLGVIKEKSRHLPIFAGRFQPTIFGTTKLNFCVRNGNRWNLGVIGTGYECALSNQAKSLSLTHILFSFEVAPSKLNNDCVGQMQNHIRRCGQALDLLVLAS